MIRNFTRSALEPYGYRILLARDGWEGAQIFQESSADIGIVLLDLAMPGMDGLETLERIQRIRQDVPVLVCSGFGDVEVETRFAGRQIAGFLPKPYTAGQLVAKVKECIAAAGASD